MAHFAYVVNGYVHKVHVLANEVITDAEGIEHENLGKEFLAQLHGYSPADIVQCSYNGSIRGIYPGPGFSYDAEADIFIEPIILADV
jgi:hypothetical protein